MSGGVTATATATRARRLSEPDPNVKIPEFVRRAAAEAEAAYQPQVEEPTDKEQKEGQEGGQETSQEAQQEGGGQQEGDTQATGQETPPEAQEQPSTQQVTPPSDDANTWKHKFDSMQGRYNASQRRIESLEQQINGMQGLIATLQTKPVTSSTPDLQPKKLLTQQEEEDFGPELLNIVGKKAQEEINPRIANLEAQIEQLKGMLGGVGQQIQMSARERMENTLDERCPNWREINQNQNFISWLGLQEPYSGAIRHNLLKAAWERNDTPRVLAFFTGFLAEEAAVDPASSGPGVGQQITQQGNQPKPKTPLANFAAPGRAKTAASTSPAEKPIISRDYITKFYADSAAGRYNGRKQERDKIEQSIFEAQVDGRIR